MAELWTGSGRKPVAGGRVAKMIAIFDGWQRADDPGGRESPASRDNAECDRVRPDSPDDRGRPDSPSDTEDPDSQGDRVRPDSPDAGRRPDSRCARGMPGYDIDVRMTAGYCQPDGDGGGDGDGRETNPDLERGARSRFGANRHDEAIPISESPTDRDADIADRPAVGWRIQTTTVGDPEKPRRVLDLRRLKDEIRDSANTKPEAEQPDHAERTRKLWTIMEEEEEEEVRKTCSAKRRREAIRSFYPPEPEAVSSEPEATTSQPELGGRTERCTAGCPPNAGVYSSPEFSSLPNGSNEPPLGESEIRNHNPSDTYRIITLPPLEQVASPTKPDIIDVDLSVYKRSLCSKHYSDDPDDPDGIYEEIAMDQ